MNMNYHSAPEGKDPQLWRLAHKRAAFKRHLTVYIIVNLFFWVLWFFTKDTDGDREHTLLPWPVWPMLGWGIGIVFHYIGAYVGSGGLVDREYDKLIQNKHQQ
jgi:hypothetical protein